MDAVIGAFGLVLDLEVLDLEKTAAGEDHQLGAGSGGEGEDSQADSESGTATHRPTLRQRDGKCRVRGQVDSG